MRYLDDGCLEISNNVAERAIRPLALGRKNYLFAGSDARWRALVRPAQTASASSCPGTSPSAHLRAPPPERLRSKSSKNNRSRWQDLRFRTIGVHSY